MKHFHNYIWTLFSILQLLVLNVYSVPPGIYKNEPPVFYWCENPQINFGDYLSFKLVERIVGKPIGNCGKKHCNVQSVFGSGSIFYFAKDNDVIWGTGINGLRLNKKDYTFTYLDVRSVRGPLTREFLMNHFSFEVPEIYGDPALLFPYFFPEFKRKENPSRDYIIIPHYREISLYPKSKYPNVVYPTEPWDQVIEKILDSKFVISNALHGLIIADAYGIPSRLLRTTDREPFFKYRDYYLGTGRPDYQFATSIEEALEMGGEEPINCNLEAIYRTFPFELWPDAVYQVIDFSHLP